MDIVTKKEFQKRTKTIYRHNTYAEAYETNQKFACGCGEDHFIGEDGVKVNKQVDDFEFVVSCANNFETLLENDLKLRKQFPIISADFSK
jgi:hypothetical protein